MAIGMTSVYQALLRLYSGVPYHFRDGRHSFAPFHFYLEVTRRCNLRCQMCQYLTFYNELSRKEQAEGELTTEEWKDVLDQIRRSSLITFTGGEPWLRRDFMEIFEHACRRHFVHVISNGTLLREETIARSVALAPSRFAFRGFFFMGVSLDGLGEVHDEIRAQQGSFERSVESIKAVVERRRKEGKNFPMIHVTAVVQEKNLEILPEMPGFLGAIGVDAFNLTLENRSLDELHDREPIELREDEIRRPQIEYDRVRSAFEATRDAAARNGIELRLPRMPLDLAARYYDGGLDMSTFQCRVPWNTMTIDYKGEVSPCFIKNVGNVRDHGLKKLWRGAEMKKLRSTCRQGLWPACEGCCEPEHRG